MKKSFIIYFLPLMLFACVPARQYEEVKDKYQKCDDELTALKASVKDIEEQNKELTALVDQLKNHKATLEKDTSVLGKSLRIKEQQYDKINRLNDEIQRKLEELKKGNELEAQKLSGELLKTQADLQKKEDALKALEAELNLKSMQLKDREAKVKELEQILANKDKAVRELKEKVQQALLGFENNGLTIEQKNGKVYVSLEESLLFASGSYTVNSKGTDVLKKLAKVLEQNTDINVMVEGHTDNVPYKGSGDLKDNWDLSVKRATSVVKIIIDNSSVKPERLIAAGRSEYVPLDNSNTAEARKKNRRTEIILTPKIDELLKILEDN
jgi:chemotaxis protein MotB